jgi:uncharacterized protein with HEPN domain
VDYLRDILEADDAVRGCLDGITRAAFLRDPSLRDIVARQLTIVGEAVAKLTRETRLRAPDVDWPKVVAFRNVVVHDYFAIDWRIVWRVAGRDLPSLRTRIALLLAELERGGPR